MLALGNGQALEGIATSATTVTCTVMGTETTVATPPVATGYTILAQAQLAASAGSLYTPSGSNGALISSIHLFNTSGSVAQTVSLFMKGAAGANQIMTTSIPAGGFAEYEDGNGWSVYTANGVQVTGAGLTNVSAFIGSTVAVGATTFTNLESISLSPGTWLIFGMALLHLTTATLGHVDVFLGPTTASKTNAYCADSFSIGDIAGGVEESSFDLVTIQTFTTTTTVFLECYASEAVTAENTSTEQTIANATGIVAIKIG